MNADHELEISDSDFLERIGPKPGLLKSKNLLEEIAFTHALLQTYQTRSKFKICIVICNYTNYELQNYSNKFDFEFLDGKKVLSEKSIFISDLEQSKGFEFDLMFILNCNKDTFLQR